MPTEVTAIQAAQIIKTSHKYVWEKVRDGKLPARRQGERRIIRIEIDDLRAFAKKYGHLFDDSIAEAFTEE